MWIQPLIFNTHANVKVCTWERWTQGMWEPQKPWWWSSSACQGLQAKVQFVCAFWSIAVAKTWESDDDFGIIIGLAFAKMWGIKYTPLFIYLYQFSPFMKPAVPKTTSSPWIKKKKNCLYKWTRQFSTCNSYNKLLSQLSTQEILIFLYDFQSHLKRLHFLFMHYSWKKLCLYGF